MPDRRIEGTVDNVTGYAIITVDLASGSSPESRRAYGKKALIDTGATNSAIDKDLIGQLGLVETCRKDSYAFNEVISDVPYYKGRIVIPKFSWAWDLTTIAPTMGSSGNYDAVIGNDILGSCTLVVVGPENRFTLTHSTPDEEEGASGLQDGGRYPLS